MAKVLNFESEIANGLTIEPEHVKQSVDAFTGAEAYDITISGSLVTTGSIKGTTTLTIGSKATIGGSHTNTGTHTTIAGGFLNTVSGIYGFIGGGYGNCVSTVGGILAAGSSTVSSAYSSISSGYGNSIGSRSECSFIGSGCDNTINNTVVTGNSNFIGAGRNNSISAYCCGCNFIGGGCGNTISGYGDHNVIVGGKGNSNSGYCSGILGGQNNILTTWNNSFIIGADITAAANCTTYVNNIHVTGSTTANAILQLSRRETTPTGVEGMIIASGSVGASKLYYYNGETWNALF